MIGGVTGPMLPHPSGTDLVAVPTRDQRASTVVKTLVRDWFLVYGVLKRIHSDQGRCFEAKLKLYKNCAACMESRNPEALLTTRREMDSVSDSTERSLTCCVPSHLRERESGLSTSRNCVVHITQLHIPLPGIPHTTSCLELILN